MSQDPRLTHITIDPEISHGGPSIQGVRYPVELILELLSSGMSPEGILGITTTWGAR